MTDRDEFEAWVIRDGGYLNDADDAAKAARLTASRAWQAATAAERERCAKVCDAIAYEWRGANSQSVQCADAIRKGE